jgi:hypothetical protein
VRPEPRQRRAQRGDVAHLLHRDGLRPHKSSTTALANHGLA